MHIRNFYKQLGFFLLFILTGCSLTSNLDNSSSSNSNSKAATQTVNTVDSSRTADTGAAVTRDPWLWPFSQDSIWNMPVGSNAVYVPANLISAGHIGVDVERHIKLSGNDPIRKVYSPSSWEKRWPGDRLLGEMPVPDSLVIPDANPPHTPNECSAFLMPDGRTVKQLEPTCRVEKGGNIVGWLFGEDLDIYGQGINGTHYGSGLSAIGGSIRKGELTSSSPICHVLKINVWGKKYLYYSSEIPGFRWPADRADSYAAGNYSGNDPKLVQGTLLAIPPDMTEEKLGLVTEPGRKIFHAMQDYGAYISDDSAWDAYDLCAEIGVIEEVRDKFSEDMSSYSGNYHDDINKIVQALNIVDNNSLDSIGGGGSPRRPLAPPFKSTDK